MSDPVALARAESLYRFACHLGVPVTEFDLVLTKPEAYDLIEWLPISGLVGAEGMPQLEEDMREAKRRDDPCFVLHNFTFHGMKVTLEGLLQ